MAGVCDGLNVVEMGSGSIPGAVVGMIMADYGARVVKIEPPEGDALRRTRPSGFLVWNRGKESRVIDLRSGEGQEELRELARAADVVVEAFRPGRADGWGVGYGALSRARPDLVYCSIKGFGSTGPYSHFPAYEGVVAAKTGHFFLGPFGVRNAPMYNDAPMASTGAGHQALAGILAALTAREQTGRGQLVEANLISGLVPVDYYGAMTWQHVQRTTGNAAGSSAVGAQMFGASRLSFFIPTADGRWINFTHMLPHQAQALSRAVGLAHTVDDPRYSSQPLFENAELAQEWESMVWEAVSQKPYAEWEPILLADDNIAFEMARRSEEGLDHEQVIHNGEAIVVNDADLGPIAQVGPIAKMSSAPAMITLSAPLVGQHRGDLAPRRPLTGAGAHDDLAHPLAGVTVVELGYYYAMPYGTCMAAAMGARVIKVEGLKGDPMRWAFGNPEVTSVKVMEGKESISVDLAKPDGQAILQHLVTKADVFVNGFRPGVAERLGLGVDTLCQLNPRLVYLIAAGYGVDGPFAHRPIYAGVASALAGQVARHAGTWMDPDLTSSLDMVEAQAVVLPRLRGPVDGDANASLGVLSALLLGIYHQRRTGIGQVISTSMIGANAWSYADDFNRYAGKQPLPAPDPEFNGVNALYRLYPARTGWVFVAAPSEKEWTAMTDALERPDLKTDERFASAEARRANDDALISELGSVLATRDAADWEASIGSKGLGVVQAFEATYSEFTCTDEVLRQTGFVVKIDHPLFGPILRAAPALRFSDTPARLAPSCMNGQHTRAILNELGYGDDKVTALREAGVIAESWTGG